MSNLATHFKLFTVAVIWGFGWPAGRVVANEVLPFTASWICLLYTSPSPRDAHESRMPSSA